METRWTDPAWVASTHEWVDQRLRDEGLRRVGEIEQPHVAVWSTVMKVPTDAGPVWFKATMDSLRHEAAATVILSRLDADLVPPPLAADPEAGWLLLADAGERLREVVARERSLERWLDVLGRYATLQVAATDVVDELLAAGVPDRRLATLPNQYERLVSEVDVEQRFRDAIADVRDLSGQLAAFGVAETIQHDDLHDGQVFVRDDRHLVMDWGDAAVTHPFFTLSVTLEGVISWGLDDVENSVDLAPFTAAYLAPFMERYGTGLDGAVDIALRLGWAERAVNGHVPGHDAATRTRLRMFLDGRP